ncbi:MAG: AMP-binding protein, partial [Acidimicrobiales bacterium]
MTAASMHSSIPAVVLSRASEIPDAVAVVSGGIATTYGELADQVARVGRAMLAAGVCRGDRVAIWAPNSHRWILTALGAQSVGAAIVPINTRYKTDEAAFPLARTGARVLVASAGFMGIDPSAAATTATRHTGQSVRVIDVNDGDQAESGGGSWGDFLHGGDDVEPDQWTVEVDAVAADDLSDVMFTSGSTGKPKGVRHLHGPTIRQTFNTIAENGIVATDRYLIVNPFFHVFGYTGGWVPGLFSGCTVYPLPTFDVDQVLDMVEQESITYFPGPPTIFHSI